MPAVKFFVVALGLLSLGCGLVLDLQPPDDAGSGGMDAGPRDGGEGEDAGDAEDAGMSCAECEDGNPCTLDLCEGGACSSTFIEGACEIDGELCTIEACVSGVCTEMGAVPCPTGQSCQGGVCVCPFADLKPCGALCISVGTCCEDADCTAPLVCNGPGQPCACPSGQRPCGDRCISATTGCCTTADCGTVRECVADQCVCPAGTTDCGGFECVPTTTFCEPGDPPIADPTCGLCFARACGTNCQLGDCVLAAASQCEFDLLTNYCDLTTHTCSSCFRCQETRSMRACDLDVDCVL